ncbi:hypothetical protein LCGC14_0905780 [marine sediment metagenome]|uniref:Uncharacterized protein n=1 Tax=marine sediment metagenome TaxID=412755 RepID=A0A0F9RE55_9ZZZZ|nr:MAG: hypothetical protein Lokiarch_31900 [Candidatus Lokiarchaeum sp. GC14_75]
MPTGIFLIKWDEVIGGIVYMRYPEDLDIPEPIIQQITISHNFTESYIISKEKQWNSVSYYNVNKEMIAVLVLSQYDDGKDYLELVDEFNKEMDRDINEDKLRTRLEEMFKNSLSAFRTTDAVITKLSNEVAYLKTKEYDIQERFSAVLSIDYLPVKSKILFQLAINDGISFDELKKSIKTSTNWLTSVLKTLIKNRIIGYNTKRDVYYIKI